MKTLDNYQSDAVETALRLALYRCQQDGVNCTTKSLINALAIIQDPGDHDGDR